MTEHQQTQKSTESKANIQMQATLPKQIPTSHPAAIIQRARINPKSLTHADVMQLQRTIGNRAVGQLLSEIGLISSKAKQPQPVQMQTIPEEEKESLQGKFAEPLQRQEIPEEEESLQGKFENGHEKEICPSCIQRQEIVEEEEPLQGKMEKTIQLQEILEEEEPLQGKFESIQRQEIPEEEPLQTKMENNSGIPDNLKAGVESLSGIDMSDARAHYNSEKPAEVGALAYTQGTNIHVAPGQERHLPHESWHVVQQAQGRVKPTLQVKGFMVNDETGLEKEADIMGVKAFQILPPDHAASNQCYSSYFSLLSAGSSEEKMCMNLRSIEKSEKPIQAKFNGMDFLEAMDNPLFEKLYFLLPVEWRNDWYTRMKDENVDYYTYGLWEDVEMSINDWFINQASTIMQRTPNMITIERQNPANYGGYPSALRFRWFSVIGPNNEDLSTIGINLHRGPKYAGLGHSWVKIMQVHPQYTVDVECNKIFDTQVNQLIVSYLENHALNNPNQEIQSMADNNNCVPPSP